MSNITQELKEKDYDKYLACLFAKNTQQQKLAALFLFHHEIYDSIQSSSEPMIAKRAPVKPPVAAILPPVANTCGA